MATPVASARERLLAAAHELFYAEGVQTVGIDRVIARAGVAKASLYNVFGSKEELVARLPASERHARTIALLRAAAAAPQDPRERLLALFDAQAEMFAAPAFAAARSSSACAEAPADGLIRAAAADFRADCPGAFTSWRPPPAPPIPGGWPLSSTPSTTGPGWRPGWRATRRSSRRPRGGRDLLDAQLARERVACRAPRASPARVPDKDTHRRPRHGAVWWRNLALSQGRRPTAAADGRWDRVFWMASTARASVAGDASPRSPRGSFPGMELHQWTAREIRAAVVNRELSATEVVERHLARIEQVNPKVNAIVTLEPERALRRRQGARRAADDRHAARPAPRPAGGHQGPHRHRRDPHHLRLADLRRPRPHRG